MQRPYLDFCSGTAGLFVRKLQPAEPAEMHPVLRGKALEESLIWHENSWLKAPAKMHININDWLRRAFGAVNDILGCDERRRRCCRFSDPISSG
jgi:hypothetical protein